jgi:hypothetical protein
MIVPAYAVARLTINVVFERDDNAYLEMAVPSWMMDRLCQPGGPVHAH